MRILAIDCGLTKRNPTGLAVVETDELQLLYGLAMSTIAGDWVERVIHIVNRVRLEIESWHPEAIAWEIAPLVEHENAAGEKSINADTLMKLSHIGGAMIGLAAAAGLACQPVYPAQAKVALTQNAQADKRQMIRAVEVIFGHTAVKDIADACGVALAGEALLRQKHLIFSQE